MNTPGIIERDWWAGDDPGMNCWCVIGADSTELVPADLDSWTLTVYDLGQTVTPIFGPATTTPPLEVVALAVDGYWTVNDIGYNVRHYLKNSDFTVDEALIAGHTYRFVYVLTTGTFDNATAGSWGAITLVRQGTCRPHGA